MGKVRRSYRKAINQLKFAVVAAGVVGGTILLVATSSYLQYLWIIPGSALLLFFLKILIKLLFAPDSYVNENGYVVLSASNELEHRHIAKQLLGRNLHPNEIVHHINGKKTDNEVRNLCLMDREKHELFHSWLSWKRNKSGRYPRFEDQIRLLEGEYGGTLLENIAVARKVSVPAISETKSESTVSTTPEADWPRFLQDADDRIVTTTGANKLHPDLQKKLFVELRNERKRLSEERNVPAYMVFHDKTLIEMSETMPDSKHAMFELRDMDKEKYESYGAQFIAVIRKFKNNFEIGDQGKKDPA